MNETIKLNLGSGDTTLKGYVNIDRKFGSLAYPLAYPDNSIDEVRASHVLEHFPRDEVGKVVADWARVLKPGGVLKVAVPDFDWIVSAYQNGYREDRRLEHYLYGGQEDGDDFHKALFNEPRLQRLLQSAGLSDIKRWPPDADDCSAYGVSLNLEGRKPAQGERLSRLVVLPACEFLKGARGVIHVGASSGQERNLYKEMGLPVVWIEPIPDVFEQLQKNIAGYPDQRALNYLITDRYAEYDFHISSNRGESSSIFDFEKHAEVWPDIDYVGSIRLQGRTLKNVIQLEDIDLARFDTLILDVQGAELLVLKGLGDYLDKFKYVRCEAQDIPFYKGGCLLADLDEFFAPRGFNRTETWQYQDKSKPEVSHLYEALYTKKAEAQPKRPPLTPIYIEDDQTGAKALYRVAAVTTVPRLGFQAHAGVLERAFGDPKMLILRTTGVFWEQGIQCGINSLVRARADYVITIDYDSIFTNDDVKELLKLVVRYPEADAIAAWQPGRGVKDKALAGIKTGNGWGGLVSVEEMKRSDLTPVDNTVFGLTIIKTEALKKMAKPWFLNTPNADGEWEEGKHDADSYFWHKFTEAGNKVFMANKVRIGHLQEMVLWVDEDFNFTKQELQDWYKSGRPF